MFKNKNKNKKHSNCNQLTPAQNWTVIGMIAAWLSWMAFDMHRQMKDI